MNHINLKALIFKDLWIPCTIYYMSTIFAALFLPLESKRVLTEMNKLDRLGHKPYHPCIMATKTYCSLAIPT